MGWTSFYSKEKPLNIIIRELSQSRNGNPERPEIKVIDHSMRGNVFYGIVEVEYNENGAVIHYGVVVLFTHKRGEFSYKVMEETCHPYYYDAPLRIINTLDKLQPVEPTSNAGQWRATVRNLKK